jgi:hypothetical protein
LATARREPSAFQPMLSKDPSTAAESASCTLWPYARGRKASPKAEGTTRIAPPARPPSPRCAAQSWHHPSHSNCGSLKSIVLRADGR